MTKQQNLEQWLELWAHWLDDLISSGIANIAPEVHSAILSWADTAELLGFSQQAAVSHQFLSDNIPLGEKTELFYQLMVHYDLLQRLFYAEQLSTHYNDSANVLRE